MSARVSVIVPVYNGARFLRAALESALAQTLPLNEIIVIDDGSTDATAEIARTFPVDYVWQANAGVSAARNVAIERAQGDYLALLDADDIWEPEKLAAQVAALEGVPYAYATCHVRFFIDSGPAPPSWVQFDVNQTEMAGLITPSSWLIPRPVWDLVGPFRPELRLAEDVDWMARAKDLGVSTVVLPAPLVRKRLHDDNLTAQVESHNQVLLDALRRSLARRRVVREGKP